jgi:hypothetical protein
MRRIVTLLLPLFGCTYMSGDPNVLVTSRPPGAEILVDGRSTGLTTPALLDLGGLFGGDHEVTLQKDGYEPETRIVRHYTTCSTSRWVDGADLRVWRFPTWWTLGDWFLPFAVDWRYAPHDLYVVLYRVGEAPVHAGEATAR